ncbi:MAG TPA: M28 family peptidase, partial [Gaiellaceae bacterium]|nr:M28 family peptidase [Gaiellaceae bacterium]
MAASQPPARRRRRPRRGSIERPVDSRLYRGAYLVLVLPLLIGAFSILRPTALPAPLLPPADSKDATYQLVKTLASTYPDRAPGTSGAIGAATWLTNELKSTGLPVRSDAWSARVPGLGREQLRNIWAIAPGESSDAIVVMAHRDDTGSGPGANDNATGTAELIELAHAYTRPPPGQAAVQATHTLVFLSTDAGVFGGLGALRFAQTSPLRGHVVAVVNLDALGGAGPPRLEIAGDLPHTPDTALVQTAAQRLVEQTGTKPGHPGFFAQLVDLGFPFTLYEQGPFVARGISAVTLTTSGDRPAPEFADSIARLQTKKLAEVGLAAQELLASLDQGLELTHGTTSYIWVGNRMITGWAIELVLIALLVPYLVGVVDLFAFCRRRRIALLPAAQALRSRIVFWLFAGLLFELFRLAGAWPQGAPRPPNPDLPATDRWPVVALIALLALVFTTWLIERRRLRPIAPPDPEEQIAGYAVALLGLGMLALLVVATNPFALIFVLPTLHIWLWLPSLRNRWLPLRLVVFVLGLAGPAIVIASLAWRFGLGLDAPWYLIELITLGYVTLPP